MVSSTVDAEGDTCDEARVVGCQPSNGLAGLVNVPAPADRVSSRSDGIHL